MSHRSEGEYTLKSQAVAGRRMIRFPGYAVTVLIAAICLTAAVAPARAENWPSWRGPHMNGLSGETGLPTTWSPTEGVAWKLALPGAAGSTPVIWGDQIFLTSADKNDLILMAVTTAGKEQWRIKLGSGDKAARGDEGNLASPSPSTDGKHVWAFVGTGDLVCCTVAGKEVWRQDLQEKYGKFKIQFGMSSTPILYQGRLYLQLIHGEGDPKTREAKVVCLEADSGKQVWVQERPSEAHSENEHSYASPTLYVDDKQAFLLTHGADYVIAHRLEDGKELWRAGDLHPPGRYDPTLRLVASPVANEGLIIVPSAKGGQVLALKPGGMGDITKSSEFRLWTWGRTPDVPSPIIDHGLVYLCREDGILICLDAKTGEKYYDNKRTHAHRHRASPVLADGKIYITSRDGVISVVKAGKEFELLSQNKMDEDISASPAISNGRIYLRGFQHLWAIGPAK